MERDPLYLAELASLLEESMTPLRHEIRNRLSSMRNMAFYLKRKLMGSEVTRADPRVEAFLGLIESEIIEIDELLETWSESVRQVYVPEARRCAASEVLGLALKAARLPPSIDVETEVAEGELSGDPLELALAVRCLLENAAEAAEARVTMRGLPQGASYRVEIENDGEPLRETAPRGVALSSQKPGHLGLGLRVVRRIASRYGSSLKIEAPKTGTRICWELPA